MNVRMDTQTGGDLSESIETAASKMSPVSGVALVPMALNAMAVVMGSYAGY